MSNRKYAHFLPVVLTFLLAPSHILGQGAYEAVIIEKDDAGRLPDGERAQLQEVYDRIGANAVGVWVVARVEYDPEVSPDSRQGIAQQRRINRAIRDILDHLAASVGLDGRLAERTATGPYVAVPVERSGLEELVRIRTVEAFYILVPRQS